MIPSQIAGRRMVGEHTPFLSAELSWYHNDGQGRALALKDAAAEARADVVKLQSYTADTIMVDSIRPGQGIGPRQRSKVSRLSACRALRCGEPSQVAMTWPKR